MIDAKNVKQALNVDVALSSPMIDALSKWTLMYENKSPWLKTDEIHSLNLAAGIASEISRTVTIEMAVELGTTKRAKYLLEQFEPLMDKMRIAVEFGCAKGGLMLKPYPEGENILVDIVQADQFYPVHSDSSGNIFAAVFVDQRQIGKYYFTRLEYHNSQMEFEVEEGEEGEPGERRKGYIVQNKAYRSETREGLGHQVKLSLVPDWADLEEEAEIQGVEKPLFAYFKYPLANNLDALSPLGVSCFSRAADLIKEADKQWSSFLWEIESGKRALYIDSLAQGKDDDGKPLLPNVRLYRFLETGSMEGELFKDWTPDIREEEILSALDATLKKIEFNCGLAFGTISDPNTIDKTATEIKMSKQRTAATITDTQKALQRCLDNLFEAMDAWATISSLGGKGKYAPVYKFDDSIVVDKEAQVQLDLQLEARTIIGKVEFRMRNFKEDEETAKEKVAIALKEKAAMFENEDLFKEDKQGAVT